MHLLPLRQRHEHSAHCKPPLTSPEAPRPLRFDDDDDDWCFYGAPNLCGLYDARYSVSCTKTGWKDCMSLRRGAGKKQRSIVGNANDICNAGKKQGKTGYKSFKTKEERVTLSRTAPGSEVVGTLIHRSSVHYKTIWTNLLVIHDTNMCTYIYIRGRNVVFLQNKS